MVRTAKPTTPAAATPAPAKTVDAPAAKAPKTPKAAAPKNTVITSAAPAPAPADGEVEAEDSISTKMVAFNALLQQVVTLASTLKVSFKVLEKLVAKEVKAGKKASSKKSKRSGNRQPSGFVRPTLISNELADFLSKPHGTELARTAVSKEINAYIRTNNLQDKENGRQINADAKLTALLKLQAGDNLTYFNLQRYMKHHFVKAAPAPAPTA
jgi:upstream activation factor subunit UAF30